VIVDMHHHLLAGDGYADGLVRTMDTVGVDLTLLSGLGLPSDNWVGDLAPSNVVVERAVAAHPGRLAGLGVVRLGDHGPRHVRELHERGFVGLKTTRPRRSYDDASFDEIYAEAERLRMPILFHTGFIVGVPADRADDVSSARCRPVALDRVARTFPNLVIVMAHLGMPWHDEAAQMCRFHPNVYADLSGSLEGWRNRKPPAFFDELFYWPDAWEKVLFGSDVHYDAMPQALEDHRRLLRLCHGGSEVAARLLGETAYQLFRIEEGSA
jgi:predicted TIM-barrel fold metal-dependent hydrolase